MVPIEIKRHYHPKVWSSLEDQLRDLYTRDSRAEGHGIYVIFWFGISGSGTLGPPCPQTGIRPTTAKEMAAMLEASVPKNDEGVLSVIVIDVSAPS